MVRFGMIGVGKTVAIARRHAEALKKCPDVQITALFSRTRSRTEEFARSYCPNATICGTLQELLELVDCVCICSPNQTHAAYAIAALQAGKGVLCEKPLGGTPEEIAQLRQLSKESGIPNLVGYNFRYQPPVKLLRSMLEAGELGRLLWYQEQKGGNRLADFSIPYEWRMSRASGGGSTMDFCSHMLDHYLYLSGAHARELHLRCAQMETYAPHRPDGAGGICAVDTEDFTHLSFTGPDGAAVALTASRVGVPYERLEIVGTKAMAAWSSQQPEQLLVWKKDVGGCLPDTPQIFSCPGSLQQTYDEQDCTFVDAWLSRRAVQPSLADGCDVLALLQEAIEIASQS